MNSGNFSQLSVQITDFWPNFFSHAVNFRAVVRKSFVNVAINQKVPFVGFKHSDLKKQRQESCASDQTCPGGGVGVEFSIGPDEGPL